MNDSLLRNAFQLHQSGRIAEAAGLYGEILKADPDHCDALYLLGVAHFQRGQFLDALFYYDRTLDLKPDFADGHAARGAALSSLGRHSEALAAYDAALARNASHAIAWNHRGNALLELKREAEAVASYERALQLKPDYADAWRHRAVALSDIGRFDDALASFARALSLSPHDAHALEQRAALLMRLERQDEAIADYTAALARDPQNPALLYNRANALSILKRYGEAIRDCEAALRIAPDYPYARGVLVHCKLQSADWRGLEDEKEKVRADLAAGARIISPFNHKALSDSPEEQLQCARVWVANEIPPQAPLWRGEPYTHDKIRLAYVSADFNNSAVAGLMVAVFEHHDRGRFETIAISFGPDTPTPMRARLETAFDRFVPLRGKSPFEIASTMRALQVDIAVDLMGYTGECLPAIFAHRPAPVQANYLGFPGTMGAPFMDYILADSCVIPEESGRFYQESVVTLPHSYLPAGATAVSSAAPSRAEAGLPEEGFVFVSFNNIYKFNPAMFDIWMRLLGAVPGSILWLPEVPPEATRNLRREAEARGIAPGRIVLAPKLPAHNDHLARLALADLFLDTLPYNAHSTAIDALHAGLPVLTLAGASFAGRAAASLLTALGVPELVAHSASDYEKLALTLASDAVALAALRQKIARNRAASPLFDPRRFTRNLEAAYGAMWERHRRGEPPAAFAVADAS